MSPPGWRGRHPPIADETICRRVVLLGTGQSLRGDDAAGLLAVRSWLERHAQTARHPRLRVEILPLAGLALLELVRGADAAIIVDAVHSSAPAGTVHLLSFEQLANFERGAGSAHGWGIAETLALGYQLYPEDMPDEVSLIGIEGENFSPGEPLSNPVRRSMPAVVEIVESETSRLLDCLH